MPRVSSRSHLRHRRSWSQSRLGQLGNRLSLGGKGLGLGLGLGLEGLGPIPSAVLRFIVLPYFAPWLAIYYFPGDIYMMQVKYLSAQCLHWHNHFVNPFTPKQRYIVLNVPLTALENNFQTITWAHLSSRTTPINIDVFSKAR